MVLLPEHYATSGVSYPVVELLHGHPGDPIDLFSGKAAVQTYATARGIAPFIAVVPDGNGPVVGDSWWADIKSQHMATAVTRDLRSWASATFRTNGSWTYAGLSSGGYAAGYLPTVDTQPVHAECGLSGFYDASRPPIPAGSSLATRQRYSPIAQARRAPALVFLAYGNRDTATERQTLGYVAALHAVHHRVIVRVYPGGHEWKVWRAGFEECLRLAVPG
jgi:enterochelin esterase-like enzyme